MIKKLNSVGKTLTSAGRDRKLEQEMLWNAKLVIENAKHMKEIEQSQYKTQSLYRVDCHNR